MASRAWHRPMTTQRQAALGLFAITTIWGATFIWMKQLLDAADGIIDDHGTVIVVQIAVGARFLIGTVLLMSVSRRARHGLLDRAALGPGILIGAVLYGGFAVQMVGLDAIGPAVSAFLTSLYIVLTAFITSTLTKDRPSRILIAGAIMTTLGAALIQGPPNVTWGLGEALTVVSAGLFAAHIVLTDRATSDHDPLAIASISFVMVTALASLGALAMMVRGRVEPELLIDLLSTDGVARPLLLLGVFGSFVALVMLNMLQRHLHPVNAAVIYAFEPIWATIFALMLDLESFSGWLMVGGGSILAGNLLIELRAPRQTADTEASSPA